MSYSTYGMLPSGVWIKRKIFSLLWWVFILVMGCAHEETVQIDETAQPAGKARLVRKGEVKLHITEGPRLGDIGGVFLTEDAFYINDVTVNRIFEYNLSGYFVRTIGRRGQGVGEYMRPHPDATVVDYAGNIYTYDSASAKLNKYDKTNQFIVDLNENIRLGYTDHLLLDSEGNLLQLIKSEDGIAILQKIDKESYEKEYAVSLSTQETDSIVIHMSTYTGFCYNATLDRVYYLVPTDYRIKEVNAKNGEVLGEFGVRPPGFRPLPKKYHGLGKMKSSDEMGPLSASATFCRSMHLVGDRYLLVGYQNPGEKIWLCVYDLALGSVNHWYSLDEESLDLLNYTLPFGTKGEHLYLYFLPQEEELDTSNGQIAAYALTFN